MGADDATRDGKPQTCAAGAAVARFLTPVEALEDVWDILRADAFPGIADGHFRAQGGPPYPKADAAPAGRMLQCVADQVIEHASNCLRIHKDWVHIRLHLSFKSDLLLSGKL